MSVDLSREFELIDREIHRRIDIVGEYVVWYEFLPLGQGSVYDDVYDEGPVGPGGKDYKPGVVIPTIYAEEVEDQNRAMEDGRQPTQNVRITLRMTDVEHAGISLSGEYNEHLKDVFQYDGRYYQVYAYRARGRLEGEEVLVAVEGVEVYPDQEFVLDDGPPAFDPVRPWPETLPSL